MKLTLCRLGGLSAVKYKSKKDFSSFHKPPVKKGIYCFVWPYIEMFLCMWNDAHAKELKTRGFRKFEFTGYLWTHLDVGELLNDKDKVIEQKGSWYKVHSDDFFKAFKKDQHNESKYCNRGPIMDQKKPNAKNPDFGKQPICTDPYKRGKGGYISRDHLEVFIDKTELGKIS